MFNIFSYVYLFLFVKAHPQNYSIRNILLNFYINFCKSFSNLESQPFFRTQFWSYIPKALFEQSDIPYNKIKDLINPLDSHDAKDEKIMIIGRSLEDFALAECGIPYIMLVLTAYFEYYPEALKVK